MYRNIKKIVPAAAVSLVFFTSLAHAAGPGQSDSRMQNSNMRNQANGNGNGNGNGAHPAGQPARDPNPSARPTAKNGYGLILSGEFLWWKAVQDGLDYVADLRSGCNVCPELDQGLLPIYQGTNREPDFQYCPGFRLGIGYNTPRDGWDVYLNWTRLNSSAYDKRCAFPCDEVTSASCPTNCFTNSFCCGSEVAMGSSFNSCCTSNPCGSCNKCCTTSSSCCTSNPCGSCNKCCTTTSFCCTSNPCGSCNKCCTTSCNTNTCCGSNPCGDCNKCCDTQCCDCCEPCIEECCVCFNCGCPERLVPSLSPIRMPDNFSNTTVATADWRLRLNLLDGDIGREFYVSRFLTMRPFFGVRGAWVNQKYTVKYESLINSSLEGPVQWLVGQVSGTPITNEFCGCLQSQTKFRHDFQGVGPRFGFNTEWSLTSGLSLYANAGLNLIWGQYNLSADSDIWLCGENSGSFVDSGACCPTVNSCGKLDWNEKFNTGKGITDLGLGLQWEKLFANDRAGIMISIGWEQHLFINQNQLSNLFQQQSPNTLFPAVANSQTCPNLTPTQRAVVGNGDFRTIQTDIAARRDGDLSVQGLTVAARLDF